MRQHTPGPWVVRPDLSIETGQSGITIAGLVDMPADAHLIAAAPAMYEALQDIVEGLTDEITHMVEGSKPDTARLDYLANKAGLALAQAEGRQT